MSRIQTKQMRCKSQQDARCKRAGGYAFLVLDWLPWTVHGCCRECAVFVYPQLLTAHARTLGTHMQLVVDNTPMQMALECVGVIDRGAADGAGCS